MKKITVLLCFIIVLALRLICGASIYLTEKSNDVAVETTIFHGDASAVQDLSIYTELRCDTHLFWSVTHAADGMMINTDFTFDPTNQTYLESDYISQFNRGVQMMCLRDGTHGLFHVDTETIICPLVDPNCVFAEIYVKPEDNRILMLTLEETGSYLTVLTYHNPSILQRLEIPLSDNGYCANYAFMYDDFLVAFHAGQRITLFAADENGNYSMCFSHELTLPHNMQTLGELELYYFNAIYDGTKLAIGVPYHETEPNLYIAIYDTDGLVFDADYTYPMTTSPDDGYDVCRLSWGGGTLCDLQWLGDSLGDQL